MLARGFPADKVGSPLTSRLIAMGCMIWSCIMFNRRFWVCALFLLFCTHGLSFAAETESVGKTPKPLPDDPARMELLRLQIFLDQAGFRPGKLDGLSGEFTQKAADRLCDGLGIPRGKMPDVSHIANPYRQYTVGDDDAKADDCDDDGDYDGGGDDDGDGGGDDDDDGGSDDDNGDDDGDERL